MKKTRIILLLFSAMQLASINNISANTENGLHLTTASLKVKADGQELCTAELQKAIDRIAAQGGSITYGGKGLTRTPVCSKAISAGYILITLRSTSASSRATKQMGYKVLGNRGKGAEKQRIK